MEIIFIWIICGLIAGMIGSSKGSGCSAFFVGFLLGPFGIIIALIMSGNRIKCPYCRKEIDPKAVKCPYCQSEITHEKVTEVENEDVVYCHNCGGVNPVKYKHCTRCGKELVKLKGKS